ncbi:oxygen-independent coproporphyrinogen III oxidase [Sphingomonas sp. NSE70-1]|uniref:Coproporphyrinogen-III oxidase n=1 Tax=Sphingomonas caseinilyticus TaxID=2908205 RepID=A0ABT0RTZ6_9SPHN|nr:oxygen-independent coproporphyrinogen III oxidase [Sphingomonas caseinilyticus]MCL6698467.1 oxygen-independent coproporphyrinogen III oxidase [Sphingomonas caseinilyticus]
MTGWTYFPELLATPVPRYTSYPTAAEFGDAVGARQLDAELAVIDPDRPVSLYVHIPYCHEICWYCGCNTGAANKTQRLTGYLDTLHQEIELVAGKLGGRGNVRRIALGGGSPNAISPNQFAALLATLRAAFSAEDAQLSIELDPRSLDASWYQAIADAGVTRASLGVQTLDPKVQRSIGRLQPEELIRTAVKELRSAGIRSLNFDLMYGLPYQGLAELNATLAATIDMRPERIALFGYAHVPHLIARQRRIDGKALPDAELRFRQAEFGHKVLTHAGYDPIGFDHYARPDDLLSAAARQGQLRRNFQGFTEDGADILIGLGASAISQFPGLIVQNEKNAGRYKIRVSSGLLPATHGIVRTAEDERRRRIIEQILCDGEGDFLFEQQLLDKLQPFLERGLVTLECGRLRLPDYARPYARVIAALFDQYRQPSATRFSNAI